MSVFAIGLCFLFVLVHVNAAWAEIGAFRATRDKDTLAAYLLWISEDNEDNLSRVSFKDLGGGNIVMQAKKAFAAGDVVLRIPKRLVISSDMIKSTPQGARVVKLLERKGIEYSEQWNILLLELYILTDRLNSESRFRLFYDMLPTNLAGFPSTWSYEELCELQSDDILQSITYQNSMIDSFISILDEVDPTLNVIYDRNTIVELYNFVNSRNGMISSDNLALNIGDFFNHNEFLPTVHFSHQDENYIYWSANTGIVPGTELESNYDIDNNRRAILSYGFVLDNPAKDRVWLTIDDPTSNLPGMVSVSFEEDSRNMLMSILRRLAADSAEEELLDVFATDSLLNRAVTVALEKKMLLCMAKLCKRQLDSYPTSLSADVDALEMHSNGSKVLSLNQQNAVRYRMGQKKILHDYYDLALTALKLLTSPSEETFKRHINTCKHVCLEMTLNYCLTDIDQLYFDEKSTKFFKGAATRPSKRPINSKREEL